MFAVVAVDTHDLCGRVPGELIGAPVSAGDLAVAGDRVGAVKQIVQNILRIEHGTLAR